MRRLAQILLAPFVFITKYFKACVFLLIVFLLVCALTPTKAPPPNLAKIYLAGAIMDSQGIEDQIKRIEENPSIKGVLLIVNSPGGALGASVEISDMIKELKEKMPVVAYVQGMMASGGYYGGMHAHQIIANRGALVGSIGVIFSGVNIEGLLHKAGISTQGASAGEYKEVGTFTRAWSKKEREFMQALIREEYMMFVSDVARARGLDVKQSSHFADGKILSALNAKKLGLIDEIGSKQDAILALCKMSGVEKPVWLEKSRFENLVEEITQSSSKILFSVFGANLRAIFSQ